MSFVKTIANSNYPVTTDMTTFARIGDDQRPSISVDPSLVISKIEDNVYGGFTECV